MAGKQSRHRIFHIVRHGHPAVPDYADEQLHEDEKAGPCVAEIKVRPALAFPEHKKYEDAVHRYEAAVVNYKEANCERLAEVLYRLLDFC